MSSIGQSAFDWDTDLISVVIPDSVTNIGNYVFRNCSNLTSVTIVANGGNAANVKAMIINSIDDEGVGTDIANNIIWHMPTGDEHAKTWYKYAGDTEWHTVMLSGTIALVDEMGSPTGQIENPPNIVAISIGTGTQANPVTNIGDFAFMTCNSLTSVTIPNSVSSIGDNAFWWCSMLAGVTIPNSVTSIGADAFSSCNGLTSVTIPDGVTSIGQHAFNSCTGLTDVTIRGSATSIGKEAFGSCIGLTSMTFDGFDVSTAKSLITSDQIFGDAFYDPDLCAPIEKTFLVTCADDGAFNVTFGTDYSITFQDL